MNLLFIIYIFVLFVVFSPNFIFPISLKTPVVQAFVHGLIFSVIFYMTYPQIIGNKKEGATIGTYESEPNNITYDINISNATLGTLVPDDKQNSDKTQKYENESVVLSKKDKELYKLTEMQPYDYNKFRSYDYENMKKRVHMLNSHKHSNLYDDVPNLSKKRDEILCAADYGKNTSCCRQPHAYIPDEHVCGPLKPHCVDYIDGQQWGKCVENNPHPTPTLDVDKNVMEKIIMNETGDDINESKNIVIKSCD